MPSYSTSTSAGEILLLLAPVIGKAVSFTASSAPFSMVILFLFVRDARIAPAVRPPSRPVWLYPVCAYIDGRVAPHAILANRSDFHFADARSR